MNYFTFYSLKFLEASNISTSSSDSTSGIASGELCQINSNYYYNNISLIFNLHYTYVHPH